VAQAPLPAVVILSGETRHLFFEKRVGGVSRLRRRVSLQAMMPGYHNRPALFLGFGLLEFGVLIPHFSVSLESLQQRLVYAFRNPALLECALTHPSHLQDNPDIAESNQRLEFLGDAVLQLVLSETLFRVFPGDREGALSQHRSLLSKGKFLSTLAREIDLSDHLRLGFSEEQGGGRNRDSSLEDAMEALIGAIYLDSDLAATRRVVLGLIGSLPDRIAAEQPADNPKGRLQEQVQPGHGNHALRYDVTHISGQDHAREYEAVVHLNGEPLGTGRGTSKKAAEEAAAREALEKLRDQA
jgi:ribonuclease-3